MKNASSNSRNPVRSCKSFEAGCGREWYFQLDGISYEITGIDLDPTALRYRQNGRGDLHRAIVGDLRTVTLPANHFDVIYCSFVLEHIEGAQRALDNFVKWLKPGGLLIARVPDVTGVQTFLAKRLPRWVAIVYYRHVWKIRKAGMPGFAPYPACYDNVISRSGFHEYCRNRSLVITKEFGVGSYAERGNGVLRHVLPIVARLINWLSGGKVHDRHVDLTFVVHKLAAHG